MMGDIPCLCGVHFCSAEVSTRTSGCKGPLGEVEYPFSRSRIYGAGYKCCTQFKRENLHGFSSVASPVYLGGCLGASALVVLNKVDSTLIRSKYTPYSHIPPVYPMRSGQVR